jgi:hypothetical protein
MGNPGRSDVQTSKPSEKLETAFSKHVAETGDGRTPTSNRTDGEHSLAGDYAKLPLPGEPGVQETKFEPRYLVSYCSKTRCKLRVCTP